MNNLFTGLIKLRLEAKMEVFIRFDRKYLFLRVLTEGI